MSTHFTPTASPGLAWNVRIAACGVQTNGGILPDGETAERYGSSNIANVTCAKCRGVELRISITTLRAELDNLVADYEDGDKQDAELRGAIKKQKKTIRELENQLAACAVSEVA